jgi:queuine tRNA-ribosyltransferase
MMNNYFNFQIIKQSTKSRARVGIINTPHGVIETPNFVPVGTNATLKAIDSVMASALNIQLMFCNTYHLMLQPGEDLIAQAGGLHQFMNRKMPLITDSGGFQVFSLAYGTVHQELKSQGQKQNNGSVLKINENGVLFRSYRDGKKILLTPETSVDAQKKLGADIIIPFDELPGYHVDKKYLINSLARTHRWEKRSLDRHLENPNMQAMYAVVHGGIDQELRQASCEYLGGLPFDGYAIGGSVGKNHDEMYDMLDYTVPKLPQNKPNHLLGIGDLKSIKACVQRGIDTMDSSHPTRCARHGLLFNRNYESIRILASENKTNFQPIDEKCVCYTCVHYNLAYLHHLYKAHETTGIILATVHNLHTMMNIMADLRNDILNDLL